MVDENIVEGVKRSDEVGSEPRGSGPPELERSFDSIGRALATGAGGARLDGMSMGGPVVVEGDPPLPLPATPFDEYLEEEYPDGPAT